MKLLTNKVIYVGFVLNILIVLTLAWTAFKRTQNKNDLQQLMLHKEDVALKLQKTLSLVTQQQNAAKAYVISENEKYISHTNNLIFETGKCLEDLKSLLQYDQEQLKKLRSLEDFIAEKTEYHNLLVENVKYRGFQAAKSAFASSENWSLNNKIDQVITDINNKEEIHFYNEKKGKDVFEKTLMIIFITSFTLSILLLVAVLFVLRAYLKIKKVDEKLLGENAHLLKSIIDNSSNLIYIKEINGEYLLTNQKFDTAFRKETASLKGKTDYEIFSKETADKRRASDLEILKTGKELKTEEMLPQNGNLYTYITNEFPIKDENNRIYAIGGISIDISESAQKSSLLIEKGEQIQKIFNAAPDAIIVIDEESKILRWNPKAEELFIWKADEVIGKYIYDTIMPPQFKQSHINGMKHYLQTKEGPILNKTIELKALNKNNVEFDIELTVSPSHNDKYIFIAFIKDITQRKKLEQDNQQTKNFLDSVLENIPDMLIVKDIKELQLVRSNKATEKFFDYNRKDLIGKTAYDLFPKEQADSITSEDRNALEKKDLLDIPEKSIETRNGKRWLHTKKMVINDDKGLPNYLLSISEDITEKKALEDERNEAYKRLMESEEKVKLVLENIGDAVIVTDENLLITFMNPVAENLTGWKEDEGKGQHIDKIFDIINETTRQKVENPMVQAISEKRIIALEKDTLLIKKDKTEIIINDTGSPIFNAKKEVIGAVLIFRDITEEKKTEKQIEDSNKRFMQIFNFAPVAFSISGLHDGIFMYVNDVFCKTFGYTPEELIGKNSADLNIVSMEEREAVLKKVIAAGGHLKNIETKFRIKDGEIRSFLYSVETLDMGGKPCAAIAFVDITERKNAEVRIAMILENIGEGVVVANADQHVLLSNHIAEEILGIHDSHYSSDWADRYDIFYPDGQTIFPSQNLPIEKALRGEEVHDLEIVLQNPETKERKLLRVSGQPIIGEDNRLIAAVATLKDITKLRETEKALKESEMKYRNIIGFGHDKG